MEENKKVLLRISNLKQYFPIKGGRFVKANDGISINIYEGETFGLVGESGCGKSTLGRTLLQLYKQTDGRTMYYGRTLEEMAPKYVHETIRTLHKRRRQYHDLQAKYESMKAEFDGLSETEQFRKADELAAAKKSANDAFLDVANIIGGLMIVDDLTPVIQVYSKLFRQFTKVHDIKADHYAVETLKNELEFSLKEAKNNGENTKGLEAKLDKINAKLKIEEDRLKEAHNTVKAIRDEIEAMRKPYVGNEEFERLEQFRDEGIDLARLTYNEMRHLRSDMQLIFQDPYSSLNPRMTVGQIVGEGMLAHGYFRRNDGRMQEAVLKTMEDCGLAPYFVHRYPHQFSGGQRQRIGIARALGVQPKFVVCDEAVSALDVSIQSQIINLLQDLKDQQNLTYMFITHDLSVVKYISDRIGVMYLGNMVELADSEEMFANPRHPYTEALLNAIPTTDARRELVILEGDIPSPVNPPKGCKFHTRCRYCTEICEHVTPEMIEVKPNHFVACHHMIDSKKDKEES